MKQHGAYRMSLSIDASFCAAQHALGATDNATSLRTKILHCAMEETDHAVPGHACNTCVCSFWGEIHWRFRTADEQSRAHLQQSAQPGQLVCLITDGQTCAFRWSLRAAAGTRRGRGASGTLSLVTLFRQSCRLPPHAVRCGVVSSVRQGHMFHDLGRQLWEIHF